MADNADEKDTQETTSEEDDKTEIDDESIDVEDESAQDDAEDKPKYTDLEKKLYKRAKKAEAELKAAKAKKEAEAPKQSKTEPPPSRESPSEVDEKILRATKGYDDDAIDELKFIAERENISLFAAQIDKRFIRYVEAAEQEKREVEASVGASKGSGRKKSEPAFNTQGLTPEQHKALWEKTQGR